MSNGNARVSNKLVRTTFELRISRELVKILKRMYNEICMTNEDNLAAGIRINDEVRPLK
jgi:prephenate dehydrogenase